MTVTEGISRFLSRRAFGTGDPRGITAVVAVRAAELVDASGSPEAARLVMNIARYLAWSAQFGTGSSIDVIRARRYARQLTAIEIRGQQIVQ